MVQWIRICLLVQGICIWFLVQEDSTWCKAAKPMHHNYWAWALEPTSDNDWACVPQLLKATCLGPVLCNKRSHQNEKPGTATNSSLCLSQLKKAHVKRQNTQRSQRNKQGCWQGKPSVDICKLWLLESSHHSLIIIVHHAWTADGDCSHEIKRCLILERKVMTNLDSVLKSRDITLPTKVHLVKVMVFPVVMYGYESWTIKKTEHQRIDASELWCWRRLLRVPWTARRSNQSILKQISPGYSLEGLMLKLKLQYFGHLMKELTHLKTLMLGKIKGGRRSGRQRMRWLDGITDPMDMSLSKLRVGDGQGSLVCCSPWGRKESDTTERLNWNEAWTVWIKNVVCAKHLLFSSEFGSLVNPRLQVPCNQP